MNWLGKIVQEYVGPTDIVLDLGCGIMQATTDIRGTPGNEGNLKCHTVLGVDVFGTYLDKIKYEYPTINTEVTNTRLFVDQSFDVVICLDVLEHLPTIEAADRLLKEMKRIARKYVVVYTPSEFDPNEDHVHDSWGLGENKYQKHCILVSEEMLHKHGYETRIMPVDGNSLGVYKNPTPPASPVTLKRKVKRVAFRILPGFVYKLVGKVWYNVAN